jgi:hypothetical protein
MAIFSHIEHIFTQIYNESQISTQMAIFSHIEHISHKYPIQVTFSLKWPYFHIEHILHNHFATFRCGLGFLKFLTFSWWLLRKYRASLADGILGLIIEVMKKESHQIDQTLPHRWHSRL